MSRKTFSRMVTADNSIVDDANCPILHVDMDAFFAAVELRSRPDLRGRPMMVAGSSGRGVVLSATYEARAYGVRSAIPTSTAQAMCPGIIVLDPNHDSYQDAAAEVMAVFDDVSACVERVSIDEAFLDVSGAGRTGGSAHHIARSIRERIDRELQLTATVGVAPNKFLAKLASTMAKPDGVLVISPDRIAEILRPLPVHNLWGVGEKTAKKLTSLGLDTVGEVADARPMTLQRAIGGAAAAALQRLARGIDDRAVTPQTSEVSIGTEHTFDVDVSDETDIQRCLLDLSRTTGGRLRSAGRRAGTVVIKVRFADFRTVTRSTTLPAAADTDREIYAAALRCWQRIDSDGQLVRLLGVRTENFAAGNAATQLELDPQAREWTAAQTALDAISERFGPGSVRPATLVSSPRLPASTHHEIETAG